LNIEPGTRNPEGRIWKGKFFILNLKIKLAVGKNAVGKRKKEKGKRKKEPR
jgi:hypothetical protein